MGPEKRNKQEYMKISKWESRNEKKWTKKKKKDEKEIKK